MGDDSDMRGILRMGKNRFPLYLMLLEHNVLLSCLCAENQEDYTDIQRMVTNANAACKHWSKIGKCLTIMPTNYKEWERMH